MVGSSYIAYFDRAAGSRYLRHPRSVVRDGIGEQGLNLFQHELTHRFVAFHFPNAPTWLNGLATFWQTLDVRHGVAAFSGPVQAAVYPTPLDELLTSKAEFYAGDETTITQRYTAARRRTSCTSTIARCSRT